MFKSLNQKRNSSTENSGKKFEYISNNKEAINEFDFKNTKNPEKIFSELKNKEKELLMKKANMNDCGIQANFNNEYEYIRRSVNKNEVNLPKINHVIFYIDCLEGLV